jgi:hypothetical protein
MALYFTVTVESFDQPKTKGTLVEGVPMLKGESLIEYCKRIQPLHDLERSKLEPQGV